MSSSYSDSGSDLEETDDQLEPDPPAPRHNSEEESTSDSEGNQQSAVNQGPIQKILSHRTAKDGSLEFFVKFRNKNYKACNWISDVEIEKTRSGKSLMQKYLKIYKDYPPPPPYYKPEYEIPEKIIADEKTEDGRIFLVKWTDLDYDQVTWEPEDSLPEDMIHDFKKSNKLPHSSKRKIPPHPPASEFKPLKKYPPSKHGLHIRPYQLDGLNFIANSWYHKRNALLADEMGLGKTLQSSVFLAYLSKKQHIDGPFLIAVPLSTIAHWERETAEWTDLKTLSFYGIKERRNLIKKYEFFYPKSRVPKFDILITTYEYILKELHLISEINWQVIVIDEAHRLKNHESKLNIAFSEVHAEFKLLLSGTPLQNNTEELWSILNFLDPNEFQSLSEFQDAYGELTDADQKGSFKDVLNDLKNVLGKYMLRRVKGDVEKAIAPLEEIVIECPMTPHQKAYYKSIFTKNMEYLTRGAHQSNSTNLRNVCMELRKVCNHPYLIPGSENQILIERQEMLKVSPEQAKTNDFIYESLIRSAGKMILLDKLLAKLKADGHRVLIFSQMTKMLDILGDYLNYRQYEFKRLDGSIKGNIRQASIDDFNAPNSKYFVFLLCTKAGALGINLTTADTVIIYDSDWNPQNDIQATARCHRIGQTKEVKAYRFITAKSYERKMFDRASQKLGLDHAVLESTKNDMSTEDMEKLLRYGAYYAFEEDDNASEKFGEEDIDSIISKSMTIRHENLGGGEGSTFSKAQFELSDDEADIDLTAPDFWQKYLPAVEEDDLSMSGVSIAERRKLQRDESNIPNMNTDSGSSNANSDDNSDDEHGKKKKGKDKGFQWSKNKINNLQTVFYRFGWSRWKSIAEQFRTSKDQDNTNESFMRELRSVCHVILRWLIEASEEKYPMIEALYQIGKDPEAETFENNFYEEHKEDFAPQVASGASWKLERLERMYFISRYVSTCPNAPEGLIVPTTTAAKPAEWWTEDDDKKLLFGTYTNGYLQYSNIVFSNENPPEPINQKALTTRVKSLVLALKSTFTKYSQKVGTDIKFCFQTIKDAVDSWSKREHRALVRNLGLFGYPDCTTFKKVTEELMQKTPENIENYYQKLISICHQIKDNPDVDQSSLAEKLLAGTAQRILTRVPMFAQVREASKQAYYNDDDTNLLKYLAENGFLKLSDPPPLLTERFGTEGLEGKLVKCIKELLNKRKKATSTVQTFNVPFIKTNPDGTPVFPIKINPNLRILNIGHIVYDRNNFHSERYIYAADYCAERFSQSVKDPSKKTWYKAMIVDNGGPDPIFRVEMSDDPSIHFEGPTPSSPCSELNKEIEEIKKKEDPQTSKSCSVSGPDFFGLGTMVVQYLMQNLDGVDKLFKYVKKNFVVNNNKKDEKNDEENTESKPSRSRPKAELKIDFRKLYDRADGKLSLEEFPLPELPVKEESTTKKSTREKSVKKEKKPIGGKGYDYDITTHTNISAKNSISAANASEENNLRFETSTENSSNASNQASNVTSNANSIGMEELNGNNNFFNIYMGNNNSNNTSNQNQPSFSIRDKLESNLPSILQDKKVNEEEWNIPPLRPPNHSQTHQNVPLPAVNPSPIKTESSIPINEGGLGSTIPIVSSTQNHIKPTLPNISTISTVPIIQSNNNQQLQQQQQQNVLRDYPTISMNQISNNIPQVQPQFINNNNTIPIQQNPIKQPPIQQTQQQIPPQRQLDQHPMYMQQRMEYIDPIPPMMNQIPSIQPQQIPIQQHQPIQNIQPPPQPIQAPKQIPSLQPPQQIAPLQQHQPIQPPQQMPIIHQAIQIPLPQQMQQQPIQLIHQPIQPFQPHQPIQNVQQQQQISQLQPPQQIQQIQPPPQQIQQIQPPPQQIQQIQPPPQQMQQIQPPQQQIQSFHPQIPQQGSPSHPVHHALPPLATLANPDNGSPFLFEDFLNIQPSPQRQQQQQQQQPPDFIYHAS